MKGIPEGLKIFILLIFLQKMFSQPFIQCQIQIGLSRSSLLQWQSLEYFKNQFSSFTEKLEQVTHQKSLGILKPGPLSTKLQLLFMNAYGKHGRKSSG